MQLDEMKVKIKKGKSKRVGRGRGSGKGAHTVGRGQKGQKSRSKVNLGFEGGQSPLYKRLPEIGGFKNPNKKDILALPISTLNVFREGQEVNPEDLVTKKIISVLPKHGVKLLATGNLQKKLKLRGFLFSKSAQEKTKESGSEII